MFFQYEALKEGPLVEIDFASGGLYAVLLGLVNLERW